MSRHDPRHRRLAAWVCLLALTLLGCGGAGVGDGATTDGSQDSDDGSSEGADDGSNGGEDDAGDHDDDDADRAAQASSEAPVTVVTPVAPIADLVARVGGERVDVSSLVPAGGDSHTYEPRPSDVRTLTRAQAYIGIGLSLNDAAVHLAEQHLADGAVLSLLGESTLETADLVLDHTHDGNAAERSHTHDDDQSVDSATAGPNPHVWTSLRATRKLIPEIARVLGKVDPEGQSIYDANAASYVEQIDTLDASIAEAVQTIPAQSRTLVTYHEAWSYFARDYGLSYARAVQPADYSEPSASEVRMVIDSIRELGVDVVFGSEEFPTPVLEAIARETGAQYVADLSDDVLPGEPGSDEHAYLELMRGNAVVIVSGLGGDFPATG